MATGWRSAPKGNSKNPIAGALRGRPGSFAEPTNLEAFRTEHAGNVTYPFADMGIRTFERVVAGELIPDMERKAYVRQYEDDPIDLDRMPRAFSGSQGFIDFVDVERRGKPEIYISHMGVEPQFRGTGIGRQLMQEVERVAKRRGAKSISLHVQRSRIEQLFPFYEKLGFDIFEEQQGYYVLRKML